MENNIQVTECNKTLIATFNQNLHILKILLSQYAKGDQNTNLLKKNKKPSELSAQYVSKTQLKEEEYDFFVWDDSDIKLDFQEN